MSRPATHHDSRRRALIAAAEAVFVQKGYRATTLNDLLAATGTSKGGFYHYFESKDEVLRASLDGVLEEAAEVLRSAATLEVTPTDRLTTVFRGMREVRARHGEFARMLAVIVGDETPASAFHNDVIRRLAPPLALVIAHFPVAEPRYTAELLLDALTSVSRSPNRTGYLAEPQAQAGLATALRELLSRTLGINADDPSLSSFGW